MSNEAQCEHDQPAWHYSYGDGTHTQELREGWNEWCPGPAPQPELCDHGGHRYCLNGTCTRCSAGAVCSGPWTTQPEPHSDAHHFWCDFPKCLGACNCGFVQPEPEDALRDHPIKHRLYDLWHNGNINAEQRSSIWEMIAAALRAVSQPTREEVGDLFFAHGMAPNCFLADAVFALYGKIEKP